MASSARHLGCLLGLSLCLVSGLAAQESDPSWLKVQVPRESPVLIVSSSLGPTTARPRGMSMLLDLHASLLLRNTSTKPIAGLTLRVEAQDLSPSGKGSVTTSSLTVQPGEVFPVRIDMALLRPFNVGKTEGSLVQVSLDCVLFDDLTAYGPDKLDSRRTLAVYELEARRDRRYLATLLDTGKISQLREELNFGLQDLSPQQLGLELLRDPGPASQREQSLSVESVSFPSSPIQTMGGAARVSGNEVRTPQIEVKNTSHKNVRTVEMGWIVRDDQGRDFVAGSLPSSMPLAPVQTARMQESGTLRFSHRTGQPMVIGGLLAFVNNVEFADGKFWIPSRTDINEATSDPILRRALSASPEQQRLSEIYRRKGLNGLADALKKTN